MSRGVWGEVVSQVVRLHRRKRFHKQRLLEVFRELRHSTAAMPDGVVILNRAVGDRLVQPHGRRSCSDLRRRNDVGHAHHQPDPRSGVACATWSRATSTSRWSSRASPDTARRTCRSRSCRTAAAQHLMLVRDVSRQVALESMRKDFVANASHELRSPLTVVTGYLETLLQDEALDPGTARPLQEMQRQTQRMNGIVNDLLDLSRLDALVEEAGGRARSTCRRCARCCARTCWRGHRIRNSRGSADGRAACWAIEPEIQSAFSNLVDNAAKYTPATGLIVLRWRMDAARPGAASPSPTPGPESPPNICRASPSVSTASTPGARAPRAAPASGWRS